LHPLNVIVLFKICLSSLNAYVQSFKIVTIKSILFYVVTIQICANYI
jgi:hypothetical protein